jgi:hypothetical protein
LFYSFTILFKPKDGQLFLEDLDSTIQLDFSGKPPASQGVLFTLGSIVIVEGQLIDAVFRVSVIINMLL